MDNELLTIAQRNAAFDQAIAAAEVLGAARIKALPKNWHAHIASCRRSPEPALSKADYEANRADQLNDQAKLDAHFGVIA